MLKIIVSAETDRWTTRNRDTTDRWDSGDTAGRVANVIAYVDTTEGYYGSESLSKELDVQPGSTVYAIVADYETGSTFGRSGGHAQVLDVFTSLDEAKALLKAAEDVGDDKYGFTHNGEEYYRAWVGYFERLQELAIWDLVVRERPADPFRKVQDAADRFTIKRGH